MNAPLCTMHQSEVLEQLFSACFYPRYNTLLRGGADEPLYQPHDSKHNAHVVYFRDDFFASALHEVAHWCIAGKQRRELVDFGYWYEPDGRDTAQQNAFESVEVKPQALEYLFSKACGFRFHLSADNLDAGTGVSSDFAESVFRQATAYRQRGLPERAAVFLSALSQQFLGCADAFEHVALLREDITL